MNLHINTMKDGSYVVEVCGITGTSKVGRGKTIKKALGSFLIAYQNELGIESIDFDVHALKAEQKRREKELFKR